MAIRINRRLLGGAAIVAVVLAFALWPQAIGIDTARVERGPMQVTIDEEGTTRVRERFVVSAPVAGRIERIELEPGDRVVRGKTVVATLAPAAAPLLDVRTNAELTAAVSAAGAAVGQAQAERQRATAVRTRAQSTVERLAKLLKTGAIRRRARSGADDGKERGGGGPLGGVCRRPGGA
jgi:HlyD family secretion protein